MNSLGYYLDNCQWSYRSRQNRNRENNVIITFFNITATLVEWSYIVGISASTLRARIVRGWTHEKTLLIPNNSKKFKSPSTELAIMFRIALAKKGYYTSK